MMISAPEKALHALLEDASQRDLVTARRLCLIRTLWRERYLTRSGLINRVEAELGKDCFGKLAWEDNFYRDMRLVKQAFAAAGIKLEYSRKILQSGYYLHDKPALHPDMQQIIAGSIGEVDSAQIAIYRQLTPALRFQQGCSISELAHQVVANRLKGQHS